MKRVVLSTGLHETDIRPPSLMTEFKRLSVACAGEYFGDPSRLVDVSCPATGTPLKTFAFEKDGFSYYESVDNGSVFVTPRPTQEALDDYYDHSEASRYRVEHFAQQTGEARRAHLLRSQTNWMGQLVDEAGNPDARTYVDIGTNSPLIFEEVQRLGLFDRYYSLDPLPGLEDALAGLGVEVLDRPISGVGAVTAFQQLESRFSPHDFVKTACDMLAIDGIFFFTTRTISGFDLQMLWDKTPYIFVPEHLNLLSVEGISKLVVRAGLDLVELSTPGQLDVELTWHAWDNDRTIDLPPFIRYLFEERDELAHLDFQEFLQKHRLSSHVRVAAARREGSRT